MKQITSDYKYICLKSILTVLINNLSKQVQSSCCNKLVL